jgi:hypothetical protein
MSIASRSIKPCGRGYSPTARRYIGRSGSASSWNAGSSS